jgi:hypothetical protein
LGLRRPTFPRQLVALALEPAGEQVEEDRNSRGENCSRHPSSSRMSASCAACSPVTRPTMM